jgi:glycosyltransferase involved in cell wall biosynthesis/predicted ATP-grasp superfamily ATP-dependent carboligase
MSFYSRHCSRRLSSPSPASEPHAYADWLLDTLQRDRYDALLCFGDASLHVLASVRDEIQALTGCRMPSRDVLLDADRKDLLARRARQVGIDVPRTIEPKSLDEVETWARVLEMPVIVKGVLGSGGKQVEIVYDRKLLVDAVRRVASLNVNPDLPLPILQEYIPGQGYGLSALMQHGEPLAVFAHRRLEEHDVGRGTGLAHAATGAVSVDEPELVDAGLRLLRALHWDGMAMVEFRRSILNGRFYVVEVNPRFVGSLDLAIAAGVDFPWLYTCLASGHPVQSPEEYPVGLRYRWLVSKNIAQVFEDPGGFARSLATLTRPGTRTDINLLDPMPHYSHLRNAAWWVRENRFPERALPPTEQPTRVLQLLPGLAIGGIERMVLDLAGALSPEQYITSFCTFDREGALAEEVREMGMPLHFRKRQGSVDLGFVMWLARLLRREGIDVVHAHNATAFFYGALATRFVPGVRFLYTEHDRAFPSPLRERGLHTVLARTPNAVVTVSETLKESLEQYECFPASRVQVIKNGVQLSPPTRTRTEVRVELDLADRPTVGIVARLAPVKNHAYLLRSWTRVLEHVPDAVLLVVGNGPEEPALRRLASELHLGDSVRFLGFRRDVPEILSSLDVFVLSSSSEGLSLTLLEASSLALPIVATQVGGNPEVVRNGENGILVPSEDEPAMAQALETLLLDPALRNRLGVAARDRYNAQFTLPAMVDGYARLYRQLVGSPGMVRGSDMPAPEDVTMA